MIDGRAIKEIMDRNERVAAGAVIAGLVAGVAVFAALPAFQRYVAGVMTVLSETVSLTTHAPGLAVALGVAFLVGLSMNFLPCNVPIVMTLLPGSAAADTLGASFRRTTLYTAGAMAVLGGLGFALGWLGAVVRPIVLGFPEVGVFVAGAVLGAVGLLSVGWGLRELGVLAVPSIGVPGFDRLRGWVDRRAGATEYLLLGAIYGGTGGGCPMPTYHLLLVWIVVAAEPLFGAVLLEAYVLGRVVPVAALGIALRGRSARAASLFGGRYAEVRRVNGVVLSGFGTLLIVFAGLRALAGGG